MGKIMYMGEAYTASPLPNAGSIEYDNSTSHLAATTMQGAIDELSTQTVETGTFTASTNITVLRSSLYKLGDIKFLSVIFQVTGTTTTLGTLSSGFDAKYNVDFVTVSDSNQYARLRIQANSTTVMLATTPPQNTYIAFTISYI